MAFVRKKVDKIPDKLQFKWSAEVLDEGFVAFPKRLLRCASELFVEPKAIDQLRAVLAVADYRSPDFRSGPSLAYLAFLAGMTEDELHITLRGLAERKLIELTESEWATNVSLAPLLSEIIRRTTAEG